MDRHSDGGYKRAIDKIQGPIAKNGVLGRNPSFASKKVGWCPVFVTSSFCIKEGRLGRHVSDMLVGFPWFQVGFSWFQVGFHGFSWFHVGFHGFSWFQVGFTRFHVGFSWLQVGFHCCFMVHCFSWFSLVFHGSRLVFHGSRLVFHGSWSVFMFLNGSSLVFHGFHGSRLGFHGSRLVFHGFSLYLPAPTVSWPDNPVQVRCPQGGTGPSATNIIKGVFSH